MVMMTEQDATIKFCFGTCANKNKQAKILRGLQRTVSSEKLQGFVAIEYCS